MNMCIYFHNIAKLWKWFSQASAWTCRTGERSPKWFLNDCDVGTAVLSSLSHAPVPAASTSVKEWGFSGSCWLKEQHDSTGECGTAAPPARCWARINVADSFTPSHTEAGCPVMRLFAFRSLFKVWKSPYAQFLQQSSSLPTPRHPQDNMWDRRWLHSNRHLLSYLCEQDNNNGQSRWKDLERLRQWSFNIVMWPWYESPLSRTKRMPLWLTPAKVVLITHLERVNHRWKRKGLRAREDHLKSLLGSWCSGSSSTCVHCTSDEWVQGQRHCSSYQKRFTNLPAESHQVSRSAAVFAANTQDCSTAPPHLHL